MIFFNKNGSDLMSYDELKEKIKKLDEIIVKFYLTQEDYAFLEEFSHYVAQELNNSSAKKMLKTIHYEYLLNSPLVNDEDRDIIRTMFANIVKYNYSKIDFSKVSFENFNFNDWVIPKIYYDTKTKRDKLVEYLRRTNQICRILCDDLCLFEDLSGIRVFVHTKAFGVLNLKYYEYLKGIVTKISGNPDMTLNDPKAKEILKAHYLRTRDPNINLNTQVNLDVAYNINAIPRGKVINLSYANIEAIREASTVARLLLSAGRDDVKFVIKYVNNNYYENISYAKRQKLDAELKRFASYKNTVVEIEPGVKGGSLSLDEYFKRVRYYDRVAEKIKKMNLSPFEQYLYAFNMARMFKEYTFYNRDYMDDFNSPEMSRNPFLILKNKFEVCAGYSLFLREILDRLGIANASLTMNIKENGDSAKDGLHAALLVHIKDDKYGIDQLIISDPTISNNQMQDYSGAGLGYEQSRSEKLSKQEEGYIKYAREILKANNPDVSDAPILPVPFMTIMKASMVVEGKAKKKMSEERIHRMFQLSMSKPNRSNFGYYADKSRLNELFELLDVLPLYDKLSFLCCMNACYGYHELFQNDKIREIYLNNLAVLTWEDLRYIPADLVDELLARIFLQEGLNIYDVRIGNGVCAFKVFEREYNINSTYKLPISKLAKKVRRRTILFKTKPIDISALDDEHGIHR